MHTVVLRGEGLTVSDVVAVARGRARVEIAPEVRDRVERSHAFVRALAERGEVVYGVTTGFGRLASVLIPPERAHVLQHNLIKSHSAGTGPPLPEDVVRAAMVIRANTLAKGYSGVRFAVIKALAALLNSGVTPYVPSFGSVGASGDLAPLAHIALVLTGDEDARAFVRGKLLEGVELRAELIRIYSSDPDIARISRKDPSKPPVLPLSYKEGLALCNGTAVTAGILCIVIHEVERLLRLADVALALSLEAIVGLSDAFDPRVHELRGLPSEVVVAENVMLLCKGSSLVTSYRASLPLTDFCSLEVGAELKLTRLGKALGLRNRELAELLRRRGLKAVLSGDRVFVDEPPERLRSVTLMRCELGHVQDAYSFRCAPHVHAAARETVEFARRVVEREINAVSDNPVLVPAGSSFDVVPCGNFHGQFLAQVADYLAISLSSVVTASERRVFQLLSPGLNRGLPAFLARRPGEESGLMLAQYTAAALVAEARALASPYSIHSVPTSADQEDVVSMSMNAALRLLKLVEILKRVLSIEILTAVNAILIRTEGDLSLLGEGTRKVVELVRQVFEAHGRPLPPEGDRCISKDIEIIYSCIERILSLAERLGVK